MKIKILVSIYIFAHSSTSTCLSMEYRKVHTHKNHYCGQLHAWAEISTSFLGAGSSGCKSIFTTWDGGIAIITYLAQNVFPPLHTTSTSSCPSLGFLVCVIFSTGWSVKTEYRSEKLLLVKFSAIFWVIWLVPPKSFSCWAPFFT